MWLLQAGINRKESANETNWVVCVLWKEQPVLSRAPSHCSVTGCLLSGLLFLSALWLEPGRANNFQKKKNKKNKKAPLTSPPPPLPLFLRTYPCCFQLLEAELGWDDPAQSHTAHQSCTCALDVHCVPGFRPWARLQLYNTAPNTAGALFTFLISYLQTIGIL